MPSEQMHAHYISGTHWDREWYRPFQAFRFLLVRLVDQLLEFMEGNPEFKHYHFDGQTSMLQDYVAIRPENRERLRRLIVEGRILVGPFYTMPDLFCPGEEALVRNLLLGREIAREWGTEPMPVAYTCDMFGHPSQMPQIYRGFDMPYCVLGRGTNEHTTPAFFQWQASDGTPVFCFKLQDQWGYGAYGGARAQLDPPGAWENAERVQKAVDWLRDYMTHEIERANAPVLCLMDAMDHTFPTNEITRFLEITRTAHPEVVATHSSLPKFFAEAEARTVEPPMRRGELREPARKKAPYLVLIPNCVSARVRLKLANDAAQTLLERWVEPWMAFANLHGAKLPRRFLREAWEQLLQNHAHDSICGCSLDQIHRDMQGRFEQVQILGQTLRHEAFAALTRHCADLAKNPNEFTVTVANPTAVARREIVIFPIDFPLDYPSTAEEPLRTQKLMGFTLEDHAGQPVPYQLLDVVPNTVEMSKVGQYCFMNDGTFARYTVAAELELPALGFTSVLVKPSSTVRRPSGTFLTGLTSAENEHLAIRVETNGTLSLTDKATGECYRDLLTFEDRSEVGEGYYHGHSVNDQVLLSTGSAARIGVRHDGDSLVTFRVALEFAVPARYDWRAERPAPESAGIGLVAEITLRRGARVVEVELTIDNHAEDHRLRMLFPTDTPAATTWLAHTHFDFVERPIACAAETREWREADIPEKPFLSVQSVGDGKRGLAFISAGGLHEGGVADNPRRALMVTLLRSFRRFITSYDLTDGLEKGRFTVCFALMPFAGELPRQASLTEAAHLAAGVLTRQTGARPSGYPPMQGETAPRTSFLELLDENLILSACKEAQAGTGLVVRLWNPSDEALVERLRFAKTPVRVRRVTLAEDADDASPLTTMLLTDGCVQVQARPHEIMTLAVEWDSHEPAGPQGRES